MRRTALDIGDVVCVVGNAIYHRIVEIEIDQWGEFYKLENGWVWRASGLEKVDPQPTFIPGDIVTHPEFSQPLEVREVTAQLVLCVLPTYSTVYGISPSELERVQ